MCVPEENAFLFCGVVIVDHGLNLYRNVFELVSVDGAIQGADMNALKGAINFLIRAELCAWCILLRHRQA